MAQHAGAREGLAIPVETEAYFGILIVSQIPGLCTDDLVVGEHIGEEVARAMSRATSVHLAQVANSGQARLSFARDLHDSVIQLLAGTSFRLEGIRQVVRDGGDPRRDIDALQQELSIEQRDLRSFIRQLREEEPKTSTAGLRKGLEHLLERMDRQWDAQCLLIRCPESLKGLRRSSMMSINLCVKASPMLCAMAKRGKFPFMWTTERRGCR